MKVIVLDTKLVKFCDSKTYGKLLRNQKHDSNCDKQIFVKNEKTAELAELERVEKFWVFN